MAHVVEDNNGYEIYDTGPTDPDTDDDGIDDGVEIDAGTDPLTAEEWPTSGKETREEYCFGGSSRLAGKLLEIYCEDDSTAAWEYVDCEEAVGEGYSCSDGACVAE
jgi:hypothetical protein